MVLNSRWQVCLINYREYVVCALDRIRNKTRVLDDKNTVLE